MINPAWDDHEYNELFYSIENIFSLRIVPDDGRDISADPARAPGEPDGDIKNDEKDDNRLASLQWLIAIEWRCISRQNPGKQWEKDA